MTTLQELRERHRKQLEEQESKKGGNAGDKMKDWAELDQGSNIVRILPGKEELFDFYVESALHKYTDAEGKLHNYHCRKSQGEKCPVCDFYFDLWKRHKELGLPKGEKSKFGNLATAIKPKPRYYVRAVIRKLLNDKDFEGSPVKYISLSQKLFDIVMAAITNPDFCNEDDPDNTTLLSLDQGNDFDIKIVKQGDFNNFDQSQPKPKKSRAGTPQQIAEWMDALDLRTIVKKESYEDGVKVVQQLEASLNSVKSAPKADENKEPPFDADDGESKFKQGLKV